jgi:hypothetical protein
VEGDVWGGVCWHLEAGQRGHARELK